MPTLHIEHPTQDFDTWKRPFDSDPRAERALAYAAIGSHAQWTTPTTW